MKLKIRNKELEFKKLVCLVLYYGFAQDLPKSNTYGNVGGVSVTFFVNAFLRNVVNM